MVGNIPNYNEFDILRAFLLIEEGISRAEIKKQLSLGEGTVRTILDNLKTKRVITSSKKGHMLTKKGKNIKRDFYKEISELKTIGLKDLNPLSKKGVVVKRFNTRKKNIYLRDVAIKNHAEGALILRYDKDLELPGSDIDFFKDFRKPYEEILKTFDMRPSNILVIVFAKSKRLTTNALLAVVVEMNTTIRKIHNFLIN